MSTHKIPALWLALMAGLTSLSTLAAEQMTVYKSQYCGCCEQWVKHMQESGFELKVVDTEQLAPLKQQHGVTPQLASCHTALVGGYVVEGHVPAADVQRMLEQKPAIRGLTVPGMPQSAPGMDIPGQPYQVLAIDEAGQTALWASYPG
ncbi:hypothetical protein M2366_003572 [Aeromonas sp. BIGb0405]|jgi:hypothetical protein|uniref:DUF411 domain-containing protein n=1 Tax=unclassified Aeromonas TaxID=257493 RepID=UPI00216A5402|nr:MULTISPECIES: DUF411 domain-containing protein [unclassified Aeromonas]MCS3457457.1 hypothetical protein [Aeromonas sp. BIGb0405]MCS3461618.1 hypothetical protein [Aeromonas sp. BIGb0445]